MKRVFATFALLSYGLTDLASQCDSIEALGADASDRTIDIENNPPAEGAEYYFGNARLNQFSSSGLDQVPSIVLNFPESRATVIKGYFLSIHIEIQEKFWADAHHFRVCNGFEHNVDQSPYACNEHRWRVCYGLKGSQHRMAHACVALDANGANLAPIRVMPEHFSVLGCTDKEVDENCDFAIKTDAIAQTASWSAQILERCNNGIEKLQNAPSGYIYARLEHGQRKTWLNPETAEIEETVEYTAGKLDQDMVQVRIFDPRLCNDNPHLNMLGQPWELWSNTKDDIQYARESKFHQPSPRGFTFYSRDMHVSPIADLKYTFSREPWKHKFIDHSVANMYRDVVDYKDIGHDNGNCSFSSVLPANHLIFLKSEKIDTEALKRQVFEAAMGDPELLAVDAFVCQYVASLCEAFLPLNRSLIVIAYVRYEYGRHHWERWQKWNERLRRIAENPRNLVAANNLYDANYIRHFTGIQNVAVLPSFTGYAAGENGEVTWNPTRPEILVGPKRSIATSVRLLLNNHEAVKSNKVLIRGIRDMYKRYTFEDLASHPCIVLLSPYTNSVMSYREFYRLNIPMYAPSLKLLLTWHLEDRIMRERTWEAALGDQENPRRYVVSRGSFIPAHPDAIYPHLDPNNEYDVASLKHWLQQSDFYQLPHVQYFDSIDDLIEQLTFQTISSLRAVSRRMRAFNADLEANLTESWDGIFRRIFKGLEPATRHPRPLAAFPNSYEASLEAMYPGLI